MIALIRLSVGLVWWAIVFCALYALHGVGCAAGWDARMLAAGASAHRAALIGCWAVGSLAALAIAIAMPRHARSDDPLDRGARIVAWVGFAATFVGGLPLWLLPDCL